MIRNRWKTGTAALLVCSALLAGCSQAADEGTETSAAASGSLFTETDTAADWNDTDSTAVTLTEDGASFDETDALTYTDHLLTVRRGGTYVISGTWKDGQIAVQSEDDTPVRLVLNGVSLSNNDGAAISVIQAEQVVLTLAKGTDNTVTDGETYALTGEDDPNAAIYSKEDLTLNGEGTLTVNGRYNNAIVSKDNLKVSGVRLNVAAKDDGLIGKDLLAIRDAEITLTAGGDGLKATNKKDADKGNIVLEDNDVTITSGSEGIQAKNGITVESGTYVITAGGGSPETAVSNGAAQEGAGKAAAAEAKTGKGLKASGPITISGGEFQIDASDDAVHSNSSVGISAGSLTLSTGDDGIHANEQVAISGGTIDILKSYEGIEGNSIAISGGAVALKASDDGVNVSSSSDAADGDTAAAAKERVLTISGGQLWVEAAGDGLDANGSIVMTGGTVVIDGPVSGGDGALDYDGTFTLDGGTLIAAGSAGMAMTSSDESKQPGIMMTWSEAQQAGTLIQLTDDSGSTVAAAAPSKSFETMFISSPELKKGSTYSIITGGKPSGESDYGLYTGSTFSGGANTVTAELTSTNTWLDKSGVTEARSGMPGGPVGEPGKGPHPDGGEGAPPAGSPPDGAGGPGNLFDGLDETQKQQVKAIMEKERSGELSREDAEKQLAALGITMPERPDSKQ